MKADGYGATEKMALNVLTLFWSETWPRIRSARRLHKIDTLKYISSFVRCIPWPHVDAYNAVLEKLITARTAAEAKGAVLLAKEQVIRRINHNSGVFEHRIDPAVYAGVILSPCDKIRARELIVQIMRVGPDGKPLTSVAVPWFAAAQAAVLQAVPSGDS